ncbi:hypothetical protein NLG97_g7756 [Lecanicillium saksenae]|uniref:Uncharacterized protein n=1 Tax=Lecanicillium saksenae TaxID=468837 RepID=A0ACC1QMG4_9HYPO|nr:hypothetical protein NLG97_g7756 [Lecanicillium saksenae]
MAVKDLNKQHIEHHIHVWAAIREYVVEILPTGLPAVLRTDMPAGTWEYVGFEPTKAEFDAAAAIALEDKQRFLTEALMTLDLAGIPPESSKTASFVKEIETAQTGMATRCRLKVTSSKEEGSKLAASGQVGIHEEMAVFDKIKTEEDFRRQGLGTLIMQTLGAEAHARGATTGWLIGTPDGQKLYNQLGWEQNYWVLVLGNKNIIKNP